MISIALAMRSVDRSYTSVGFTRIPHAFGQNETSEVFSLCAISFGLPFNPTYELKWPQMAFPSIIQSGSK